MKKDEFKTMFLECLKDEDFCEKFYQELESDYNFTRLILKQLPGYY